MSYSQLVAKNQRQAILELLRDQNGYSINAAILQSALSELGMAISHHQLTAMLVWLSEIGYINLQDSGILVATITKAGIDIANGTSRHPDIQRPAP